MPKKKQPNVIVFFTDQQRWDTTGVHGNPLGLTPVFDWMASQGTHLMHTFTCQPVCGPARACLQTGQYATKTGCYRNGIPLPPDCRTLAHYFRDAGYRTGYIGKWHLAGEEPVPPGQRGGYEYWLAANLLELSSQPYEAVLYDDAGERIHLPGYRTDALADAAIRFIADNRTLPFFLFLSFLEPHQQNSTDNYPAPYGYEQRYTGRWMPPDLAELGGTAARHLGGYYGMVKRLDEALGRLFDTLRSFGLLDDTIVLFTSDHGCHFKTRNAEYKRSCHESSIRVPAAMYGSRFTGGGSLREMVSLIDLPPTLLDAAGIAIPAEMQGKSVLSLLRGERSQNWPQEAFVQISVTQVGRAIRTDRYKYGVVAPGKDPVRDSCSDLYEEAYLYDLHADPYELDNLILRDAAAPVAAELRPRLLRRLVEAGEPPAAIHPASLRQGTSIES